MSRIFTIVVILALMAVVALVPRIGTEEPGLDLGDGYAYREDTLARFRLLLEGPDWSLAEPPRNNKGILEAVHQRTGLTFVLIPDRVPVRVNVSFEIRGPVSDSVGPLLASRSVVAVPGRSSDGEAMCASLMGVSDAKKWCAAHNLRLPDEFELTCALQPFFITNPPLYMHNVDPRDDRANLGDPVVAHVKLYWRENPWGIEISEEMEWCAACIPLPPPHGMTPADLVGSTMAASGLHAVRPAADLPALEQPDGD